MLASIGARFALKGEFLSAQRYDGGHINDTYFATYRVDGSFRRYVHQRINTRVFTNVMALRENVSCVTQHIRAKLKARGACDVDRRVLLVVPTVDGDEMLFTDQGEYWRTYTYIEQTVPRMSVRTPDDAFEAARAFGDFTAALSDLPVARLQETIPSFHDTPKRFADLARAIDEDLCNRASAAAKEIATSLRLQTVSTALMDLARQAHLPLRPTHNDSKITNVLFDELTGEGVCVVDLDTVMPGLTLFDVGELVRTAATLAAEDEPNELSVGVDPELFQSVAAGFLTGAGAACSSDERDAFVTAGKVMAYENGIRFLADHLNGDRYFRVHRPAHNLDRARMQFAIVDSLERQEEHLRQLLDAITPAA